MTDYRYHHDELKNFASLVYQQYGVPIIEADILADTLVQADLWGHQSHGLLRLSWYAERLKLGTMKPETKISYVSDFGAIGVIDADEGIGQVIAMAAMKDAIERAEKFGIKRKIVAQNPANDLDFLPVEKNLKYIPPVSDIDRVIKFANPDTQEYLITICDTMARMSEINQLKWQDVDLDQKMVILYTRKKKGGHLTPRKIPMTNRLYDILSRRSFYRDKSKPWVFWHRYYDRKEKVWREGPYKDRKRIMTTLCKKAGVKYFRFHALRHAGASVMDNNGVPLGAIQRILGHENRTTTEIYLHNLGSSEKDAIAVYESARNFSHTNPHMGSEDSIKKTT